MAGRAKSGQGMSCAAYGRHRGCSGEAVRVAVAQGRCPTLPDGTIDPVVADAAWPVRVMGPRINATARAAAHAQAVAAEMTGAPTAEPAAEREPIRASTGAPARMPPRSVGTAGALLVSLGGASASEAIAGWGRGGRIVGLTKGQFSLLDILLAVLERTGPADVTLSAWTVGIRDAEVAERLLVDGRIRSLRLLLDRSFPTRQPEYAARVLRAFGDGAIRLCQTHAKFVIIRNAEWAVTIRSSMNLNRNPRFEQFDLDDDESIAGLFEAFTEQMAQALPPGFAENAVVREAFEAGLDGATVDGGRDGDAPPPPDVPASQKAQTATEIDYYAERARSERARADLAELTVAQKRGDVVPVEEVHRHWFEVGRITRDQLLALPARITPMMLAAPDPATARRTLDAELRAALAAIADEVERMSPPVPERPDAAA